MRLWRRTKIVHGLDNSLRRILHAIKPSSRKSLARFDDITDIAMNGLTWLQDIVQKFKKYR